MALIPPFFLDCVVAIGRPSNAKVEWYASGFLYGEFLKSEGEKRTYRVFLVTNRHVFEEQKQVLLRFNPSSEEPAREYILDLVDGSGKVLWTSYPNPEIDIAVRIINPKVLREQGIRFSYFRNDSHVATLSKMKEIGISEGDFVYALGFPLGLIGGERNYVVVRSGNIARIQDALQLRSKEILIDMSIFPGNSGAPVVTKPEVIAVGDTEPVNRAYLIGVVKGFIPYREVAVSTQTQLPRVVFEENSGLAAVIPIDFVEVAIKEHQRKLEST